MRIVPTTITLSNNTLYFLIIYSDQFFSFFFLNDPAPPEIYSLPLPDALPICPRHAAPARAGRAGSDARARGPDHAAVPVGVVRRRSGSPGGQRHLRVARRVGVVGHQRSEEHTSELQSQSNLVCRLLLEKKKHI